MSSLKVEQISAPAILGEGPHWDHNAQALYYVDILGHTIHKYVPTTNKHTTVKIGMYCQIIETYYVTKQKFKWIYIYIYESSERRPREATNDRVPHFPLSASCCFCFQPPLTYVNKPQAS